jgi:uroporphyrinogen decarboxylase
MTLIEPEFMTLTADLDVKAFWQENEACQAFTSDKPRCALSFAPDDHWLFEFVAVPSTLRYYRDKAYRDGLHRQVNQITRRYVGRAFFEEDTWQHAPRRIENLFGCEFVYREGSTPWLVPVTGDPAEFATILDDAEKIDLQHWVFPNEFLAEWEQRQARGKSLPRLGTGSRGPATIMTSVIDPTVLFLWMYDYPDLVVRFRDVLTARMIEMNRILRAFSGNDLPQWWITDDNSALFSPRLYRDYCFPVLQQLLEAMAPLDAVPQGGVAQGGVAQVRRYQHSDSAMGHLLDQQYELGIRYVNYGPEIDVALIRERMPEAYIYGHVPPFLLRNGSPGEIRQRVADDFAKAGASGGLEVTTAGSLAAGTGVGRMRWLMQVVQEECRYQAVA